MQNFFYFYNVISLIIKIIILIETNSTHFFLASFFAVISGHTRIKIHSTLFQLNT